MGHVSVLAQLYVYAPWVLWFLHSLQPPTCVPLPECLSPCCLPEASLFGPPPYVFCDFPFPIRVMVTKISLPSPVLPLVLSVALPLALSLTLSLILSLALSVALSFTALALANLALVALAFAALALAFFTLASLALSDLALAELALADLALADLALAALVGGFGLG